jgi:hypothetical protein
MIVEFPSPFCTRGATPAVIIGGGVFDCVHGQRDAGPNGIELHPVLGPARRAPGDRYTFGAS